MVVQEFHRQDVRTIAYDLLVNATRPGDHENALKASVDSNRWSIVGLHDSRGLSDDYDDAINIVNPRNPSDVIADLESVAGNNAVVLFAMVYEDNELYVHTQPLYGESSVHSFPFTVQKRVDITVNGTKPYIRYLVYSDSLSHSQIERAWTTLQWEIQSSNKIYRHSQPPTGGDYSDDLWVYNNRVYTWTREDGWVHNPKAVIYKPYEWPDASSELTRAVYNYLPEAMRTHDENDTTTATGYPLLRYLEGVMQYASEAHRLSQEIEQNLFDPDNSRNEWLRWVSQILGLGASKRLTTAEIRERIRGIIEVGSPAIGTRSHIASIARQHLTGYKSVFVEPSKTTPWIINLIVRTNEVPDGNTGRIIEKVMESGVVPAGHRVRVLLATTTWQAYDSAVANAGGTWDDHMGMVRTWADNDSVGTDFEETPDPEFPLPND